MFTQSGKSTFQQLAECQSVLKATRDELATVKAERDALASKLEQLQKAKDELGNPQPTEAENKLATEILFRVWKRVGYARIMDEIELVEHILAAHRADESELAKALKVARHDLATMDGLSVIDIGKDIFLESLGYGVDAITAHNLFISPAFRINTANTVSIIDAALAAYDAAKESMT